MTPVDSLVGDRIKTRRLELGMTQTELANHVSVRFQQVQKYENGQNRVAASRLWQIAEALNVPVSYFFTDLTPEQIPNEETAREQRRRRELVDLFAGLSKQQQSAVMSFLRSVAQEQPAKG